MVYDNVVEEINDNDEIGLRGFYFNCFYEDEEVFGREVLSDNPYLLMLMKICPGDWDN